MKMPEGWVLKATLPPALAAEKAESWGSSWCVCGKAVKNKANQGKNSKLDLDMVKQRDLLKTFRIMTQTVLTV